jgi:CheY-like chemotaxis protein
MPRNTILCVDDDASVLKSIQNVLEEEGYKTLCATSGEEALRIFAQEESKLMGIFSDIKMPGLDGLGVMREIRKTSDLPGVAVSAYLDKFTVDECEKAGFTGRIHKPVSREHLLKAAGYLRDYAESKNISSQ